MTLYNPDWIYKDRSWSLLSAHGLGRVAAQVTRDYCWEVFDIKGGELVDKGTAPDRIAAYAGAEALLGYKYFVEEEYQMPRGCRCGSCQDPTGK